MTMPQTRKASHAGTSEPPAGSMPTVHRHRDETIRPASRRRRDDGRFRRSDCPYLKTGKSGLRIGTWNVRTLNQLGKLENLKREAESLNADIIGISETRYIKEGKVRLDNYTFIYSGGSEHQHGVDFIIKSSIERSILGYWPDFNAKIGKGSYQDLVGNYGLGDENPRGDRVLQFCIEKNLVVTNTTFQHPNRLLYTWKSPGDVSRNQIGYLLIRKRHRNSVKQCKTYPGADIGSDHNPLVGRVSVRLKRAMPKSQKKKEPIDWGKLVVPEMREKYLVDVSNKYEVLFMETDEQGEISSSSDKEWQLLKLSIQRANETAPKVERKAKQCWMTKEILEKRETRKKAKNTPAYVAHN
ncbi:craniofacial development protein 2-like [Montipora capricornis]|uniref:craniofacial development protein 2-like n=1 Tax=Montipora capricornis TaxID=246305 RepID=UPI0035F1A92B